jgi:endo-1,4-beta-xylanase
MYALDAGASLDGPDTTDASDASPGTGVLMDADVSLDGAACSTRTVPSSFQWSSSGVLISPIPDASHAIAAVKDPSVVYYNNAWHVFMSTVSATGGYNMAYATFTDWSQASAAPLYYLDQNPRLAGYHAAPEVFYFAPQNKWYLVFQSGPPQYSTNTDIANPAGWTQPANFFAAEPEVVTQNKGTNGWLDFWTICDDASCYLFFSDDNGTWYRSQTTVANFPSGFDNTVVVMKDANADHLFEASNVYRMKDTGKYLAIIEAFDSTSSYKRYFRSWTADALDGTWTPLQDTFSAPFASTDDITFVGPRWTSDISHGEMIRDGFDQSLTVDTCRLQYLYQGFDPTASPTNYNSIPWRLGLLTKTN